MRGCCRRETKPQHISASLVNVVAMGNGPSRLETRLQAIQLFPYHAGRAIPHHTRFLMRIALAAGSCPCCLSTLGKLLIQARSSSSSWLRQGYSIVRHGALSRPVGHPAFAQMERSVCLGARLFSIRLIACPCIGERA